MRKRIRHARLKPSRYGRARSQLPVERAQADRRARRAIRSRPYEPRCTPVSAISLKPAAATRSTSRSTSSTGTLRGAPRVVGMMQYEHGSAQPVCTRRVNAVRPATPGSIAAPQLPSPSPKRSAVVSSRSTVSERNQPRLVVVGNHANDVRQRARVRRGGASRSSRSRRCARRGSLARPGGSSAARPDRRSRSPSRC